MDTLCLLWYNICILIGGVIMLVENTKETRNIRNVAATMAIEDMYLSKEFILKMIEVAEGKRTSEELIKEVINKYARQ